MVAAMVWPSFPQREQGRKPWIMQVGTPGPPLYVFEKNPYEMESPFPTSTIKDSNEVANYFDGTGATYVGDVPLDRTAVKTSFDPRQFSFKGRIRSQEQYVAMKAFYEYEGIVAVKDHFDRVFHVRLMDFDLRPLYPRLRQMNPDGSVVLDKYRWDYTMTCFVHDYGDLASSVFGAAGNAGMSFNGFGSGPTSVASFDASISRTSYTVLKKQAIPSNWATLSASSGYKAAWASVVNTWQIMNVVDSYPVLVLDTNSSFLTALANGTQAARRSIIGIVAALNTWVKAENSFQEMSLALCVDSLAALNAAGLAPSKYKSAFAAFKDSTIETSSVVVPMSRYPLAYATKAGFGGMFVPAPISCLYAHTSGGSISVVTAGLSAFRRAIYLSGGRAGFTVSFSADFSDATKSVAFSTLYNQARTDVPTQAAISLYAYEDYVSPYDSSMNLAYQGVYDDLDTVTTTNIGGV